MAKAGSAISGIDYAVGAEVINDTETHTGTFIQIDFYESSTIDSIVSTNIIDDSFGGVSVDQGAHIAGYITSIKLQNGACIAYRI
jgi:hypothetical protein